MRIKAYRWYGGKNRLTDKINLLIPKHEAYYEPFMGSGAVLLNHARSKYETLSDLDGELVHFMQTLADREMGKELIEKLCSVSYEKEMFDNIKEAKKNGFQNMDAVEKAVSVYVLISQSYNCLRKNFSSKVYKDVTVYRNDLKFHLPKVQERLQGVTILNMNGIDMVEQISDNPDAFVFADPPYRHELRGKGADRAYACEFSHSEQIRFLEIIQKAKCKIMLCGYRAKEGKDLYDSYLLPCGWKCYKLADVVKSCQNKEHKDIAEEFVWINYELPYWGRYAVNTKEYNSLEE